MKNTMKFLTMMVAIAVVSTVNANAQTVPTKDVVIAVNEAFIPDGLTSQAESYVVVSGIFPNGCYRWKGALVKHETTFNHEITSVASVSQGMCIQVLVPFTKDVKLGQLAVGRHMLKFMSGDGTFMEKVLEIKQ
jgi:hypothetical protein